MARERAYYEDIVDVALRATLKEHGFKRKTHATYIQDQPNRRWIFELEAERRIGNGFDASAGIYISDLGAIFERYAPDYPLIGAGTRTYAHIRAYLGQLIEIRTGQTNFFNPRTGSVPRNRLTEYQEKQRDPILRYRDYN